MAGLNSSFSDDNGWIVDGDFTSGDNGGDNCDFNTCKCEQLELLQKCHCQVEDKIFSCTVIKCNLTLP